MTMKVLMVAGHEWVPESWWRVKIPAAIIDEQCPWRVRALSVKAAFTENLNGALAVWIHMPLGERALTLLRNAKSRQIPVIVDLCEDPWRREECGGAEVYDETQLNACAQALSEADVVVASNAQLAEQFGGRVVHPILPKGWGEINSPQPSVAWWSDGRGKLGLERMADAIAPVLLETETLMVYGQFPHQAPFAKTLPVSQQLIIMATGNFYADVQLLQRHISRALVGLDLWPPTGYAKTVGSCSALRYAAMRVPVVSNAMEAPGVIKAERPREFADALYSLITDQAFREQQAAAAYAWSQEHTEPTEYLDVLREVIHGSPA